jgi:NAD(P)-dependent dehydrogenase (short-subunit alcohol dehydrogenase family)
VSTGIVVGAAGGIGTACAHALADSADLTLLVGRRRQALETVAHALTGRGVAVPADITDPTGRRAISAAVEEPLAWIVVASGMPLRKPFSEASADEITATFTTNLIAPALLLRDLLAFEWTAPAAVSLIGSISASRSLPRRSVYSASKAGLEQLGRSLAAELAPRGIRVNIVSAGVIETAFLGEDRATLDNWVQTRVPLARLGNADETANTVRYTILDAPPYLTGARITVDGGAETIA